jgi:hypothetical protein
MRHLAALVLCLLCLSATAANGQNSGIEQVQVTCGTVLTFHLQTRMNPDAGDSLNFFPKGTVLRVRMLDSIDSAVDRDGSPFRGSIVSPMIAGNQVVVHSEAEVHGLLALLRSRSHPDGFRYELLITGVVDHGKSYTLTATLNSSFFDSSRSPGSDRPADTKKSLAPEPLPNERTQEVAPR